MRADPGEPYRFVVAPKFCGKFLNLLGAGPYVKDLGIGQYVVSGFAISVASLCAHIAHVVGLRA